MTLADHNRGKGKGPNIPEDARKPLFMLGNFVATLAAIVLAMQYLGVATDEDVAALELKLVAARARVDVLATVYQTTEGITIFWDTLEPVERQLQEIPSGPTQ